jgi:hypothetical protein
MRTNSQIQQIKNNITDPYAISDFVSHEDRLHLINLFRTHAAHEGPYSQVIKKNTGPVTLDLNLFPKDLILQNTLSKLKKEIGDFEVTAAFFFETDYPHIIHNDDTFELPDTVYKGITIPLELTGFHEEYPKLCFFDQCYFQGPAKFFNGSNDIPTYYNKQVYDYKDVDNLVAVPLVDTDKYFTHLKPQWLKGLSLHSVLNWIPGNVLIFDSVRLHCASDFRNLGITSKLGISVFTKRI